MHLAIETRGVREGNIEVETLRLPPWGETNNLRDCSPFAVNSSTGKLSLLHTAPIGEAEAGSGGHHPAKE
jgi:hypothetical protein